MSYKIKLKSTHICDEYCAQTFKQTDCGDGVFEMTFVDNPTYIDGKCDRYSQEESTCVSIAKFDETDHNITNPDEIVISDTSYNMTISYPLIKEVNFTFESAHGFSRLDVINNIVKSYKNIYRIEEETAPDQTFYFEKKCTSCQHTIVKPTEFVINADSADCVICLDQLLPGEVSCKLDCGHFYHTKCIDTWFGQNKNKLCPLCKKSQIQIINCGNCADGIMSVEFKGKVLPVEMRGFLLNRPQTHGVYGIWGHDIGDLVIESLEYDSGTKYLTMFIGS